MKKSIMSVKSMIETYVRYGLDDNTWGMLYNMACHNLISNYDWIKFANICRGWRYDDECLNIIDTNDECKVIYNLDDRGLWVKVNNTHKNNKEIVEQ